MAECIAGGRGGARNILIIDESQRCCAKLAVSFAELGQAAWVSQSFDIDPVLAVAGSLDLVVTELKVGGGHLFRALPVLLGKVPNALIAVATAYPSVASAVRATRLGCHAYLAKPVTARALLRAVALDGQCCDADGSDADSCEWPSFNRAIWEYLNQVYDAAGSMAEAARRLGLDRRSLRRMLAKYPPTR